MTALATPAELARPVAHILTVAGCQPDIAAELAESLVDAETCGHGSHGLRQLDLYLDRLKRGKVSGSARPRVVEDRGPVLRIDGNRAFGQIAGAFAARLGTARALETGVCAVALADAGHLGRNGLWAEIAASRGVASIHFGQGIGKAGPVAPFGGREGRLNTNPLAFGFPGCGSGDDVIFDCSTAEIAGSRIKQALERGELLDSDCLVTTQGALSRDPADFVKHGAAVFPFGGFKGYAISVFTELMSTMLGAAANPAPETNSMFSIYIAVSAFAEPQALRRHVAEFRDRIDGAPPMQGHDRVVLPGARSAATRRLREDRGIPVDANMLRGIEKAAEGFGILNEVRAMYPAAIKAELRA